MLTTEQKNKIIKLYESGVANILQIIKLTIAFPDINDKKFKLLRSEFMSNWTELENYLISSSNLDEDTKSFYKNLYNPTSHLAQHTSPLSWFLTSNLDSFDYKTDPMFKGLRSNMLKSYVKLIDYIGIKVNYINNVKNKEFMEGKK